MRRKNRILFVGAGDQQATAILQAKNKGYQCFTIDGDETASGFEFSDDCAIGDITDPTFIIDCALNFKVDGIVVISTDIPVVAAAKACEKLGFDFTGAHSAEISVNKLLQRELMKEVGLITPCFEKFYDFDSFNSSIAKIGFPAVIKPIDCSGSRGVTLVHQGDDLEAAMMSALDNSKSGCGLIETFIEGAEIALDGFVINGKLHTVAISDKLRTRGSHLLDTEVIFPAILEDAYKESVHATVQRAVTKFGLDNCPVHIEMIKSSNGPMIVEVAARGAGFYIFSDILPFVSGVDTISSQIQLALGTRDFDVNISCNKSAIISFIHVNPGVVLSVEGLNEASLIPGVQDLRLYVKVGDVVKELKSGSDRIGHILIFTDNRKESEAVLEKVNQTIKVTTSGET